jgi:hypothetical protein
VLHDPVWTSAILGRSDFGLALAAHVRLVVGHAWPVFVVVGCATAGWVLAERATGQPGAGAWDALGHPDAAGAPSPRG